MNVGKRSYGVRSAGNRVFGEFVFCVDGTGTQVNTGVDVPSAEWCADI